MEANLRTSGPKAGPARRARVRRVLGSAALIAVFCSGPVAQEAPPVRLERPTVVNPHAYFDALKGRAEVVGAYSLRSQAELDSLVRNRPSEFFRYVWPNDSYARPQDAAKLVKPPRNQFNTYFPGNPWGNSGDENIPGPQTLRVPIGVTSGTVLITWDTYWGEEFKTNAGAVDAWKTFFLFAGENLGGTETHWLGHDVVGIADAGRGEVSKHHEGPVGTALLPTAPGVIKRDPYQPTGAGAVPFRSFATHFNRWTRYWLEVRMNVPGSHFTDWSAAALSGQPLDGVWDMVSLWVADEDRQPVRVLYRVPAARRSIDTMISTLRMAWDTSTNNVNDGGLNGAVVAYVRNIVVLRNAPVDGTGTVFTDDGRPLAPTNVRIIK